LAPENTVAAFSKALSVGVTTLELDVGMTKDGILVVAHDTKLNPDIARSKGAHLKAAGPALRELTLTEVKSYDVGRLKSGSAYAKGFPDQVAADGAQIPTLEEVLELGKRAEAVRFNIETKITPTSGKETPDPETFARAVIETAKKAGVSNRISIQSFDWRTLQAAAKLAPDIPRVCLSAQLKNFDTIGKGKPGASEWTAGLDVDQVGGSTPRLVKEAGCSTWSPQFSDLTQANLAEAKGLGLTVVPWTVNEPKDAERLLTWGVDGLISDYPDRMRKVLEVKGVKLPAPTAGM
jgi:glycerophosphoryl diester phosphodiesterase